MSQPVADGSRRIRVTDLLGCAVVDETGRRLGRVHDLRMRTRGPVLGSTGRQTLAVDGLVVGTGDLGRRLGYGSGTVRGPWLLTQLFGALAKRAKYVEWAEIRDIGDTTLQNRVIVLHGQVTSLPSIPSASGMEATR